MHPLEPTITPTERCGTLAPPLFRQPPAECVLRPGHQGSHADEHGGRWYPVPRPLPRRLRWTLTALPVLSLGAMAALPVLYLAVRLQRPSLYGTTAVVFGCSVAQFAYLAYGTNASQAANLMAGLFLMSFWAFASLLVWAVCAPYAQGPATHGG